MAGCIFSVFSLLSFSSRTRAISVVSTTILTIYAYRGRLTKHVVSELRELETQAPELGLGLAAQGMTPGSPEVGDRCADGRVTDASVLVDVASVCDLALGGRADAVDLRRGEVLELLKPELLGKCVDARVLEKLIAGVVDLGLGGVGFERPLTGHLAGEVLARVKELEEAPYCVDVFVRELYLAGLLCKMVSGDWLGEGCRWRSLRHATEQGWVRLEGMLTLPSLANSAQASAKKGLCVRSD